MQLYDITNFVTIFFVSFFIVKKLLESYVLFYESEKTKLIICFV